MLARLLLHRSILALATLAAVSVLIFIGTELLPGDVAQAILGQQATPDTVAALRRSLGLERPAHVRFLEWVSRFVKGDFGRSLASGMPIADLIAGRLQKTLILAATAAGIAVQLSVEIGI